MLWPLHTIVNDQDDRVNLPGDLAIWFFIAAELLVFASLFICFALARNDHALLFAQAEKSLQRLPALLETLLLIASSYAVVCATRALHAGQPRRGSRNFGAALILGGVFCGLKVLELRRDFALGMSLSHDLFDMFYLSLIVFHFMHVLMGMVMLSVVTLRSRRGAYDATNLSAVESVAAFWHMVDLLWIFLFVLVYVLT